MRKSPNGLGIYDNPEKQGIKTSFIFTFRMVFLVFTTTPKSRGLRLAVVFPLGFHHCIYDNPEKQGIKTHTMLYRCFSIGIYDNPEKQGIKTLSIRRGILRETVFTTTPKSRGLRHMGFDGIRKVGIYDNPEKQGIKTTRCHRSQRETRYSL